MNNKQRVILHYMNMKNTTYSLLLIFGGLCLVNNNAIALTEQVIPITKLAPEIIKECRLINYKIEYDLVRGDTITGKASRNLKQASKGNDMRLLSSLTASMAFMEFIQKEYSVLPAYKQQGFHSSRYNKQTKKPFKSKQEQNYSLNKNTLDDGVAFFDPLSVYDHLRELICSGLRTNIELKVKEENEITQYYFEYKGEETLPLPIGTTETILFVRTRKTSTRETSIWFAQNNNFLPVKIEQEKDGDSQAVLIAKSIESNAS